jgi:hypothetical protein
MLPNFKGPMTSLRNRQLLTTLLFGLGFVLMALAVARPSSRRTDPDHAAREAPAPIVGPAATVAP